MLDFFVFAGGFTSPVKVIIVTSAVTVTVLLGVVLAYLPKLSWAFLCLRRKEATFPLGRKRFEIKGVQSQRCSGRSINSKSKKFIPPKERLPGITEHDVEVSTSM